jgi:hypothetical protein
MFGDPEKVMKLVLPERRQAGRPSLYVLVVLAVFFLFGGPAGVAMAEGRDGARHLTY